MLLLYYVSLSVLILIWKKKICVLLYYVFFPNSWDNMVVATIQSTLKFEDVFASLLSQEMRRKSMVGVAKDVLSVKGHPKNISNLTHFNLILIKEFGL